MLGQNEYLVMAVRKKRRRVEDTRCFALSAPFPVRLPLSQIQRNRKLLTVVTVLRTVPGERPPLSVLKSRLVSLGA